jgi:hypothetical protein
MTKRELEQYNECFQWWEELASQLGCTVYSFNKKYDAIFSLPTIALGEISTTTIHYQFANILRKKFGLKD